MKRFLAGLLCSAMLCSEILSSSVFAATNTDVTPKDEVVTTVETADEIIEEGLDDAVIVDDFNEIDEADDVIVDDFYDAAAPEEAVVPEIEVEPEALFEDAIVGDFEEADDEINEVALSDIDGKSNAVTVGGSDGDPMFTVSGNELQLKEDAILNWTNVVIPSYVDANKNGRVDQDEIVYTIPRGIFNDNGAAISTIKFAGNSEVQEIVAGAFENCNVETITLPAPGYKTVIEDNKFKVVKSDGIHPDFNKITEIHQNTFKESQLKVLNIGQTEIETIEREAFAYSKITAFQSPASLTTIKREAFKNCGALNKLTLTNVTNIGAYAFSSCTNLGKVADTVKISNSINVIGDYAFENCGFGVLDLKNAADVTYTNIAPLGLGKGVFKNCVNMTKITLPCSYTVRGISEEMFSGCKKLTSVIFAEDDMGVPRFGRTIEKNAFENCEALVNITFPDTIQFVGSKAFIGCNKLAEVQIGSTAIEDSENIADDAFPKNKTLITLKGRSFGVEKYCQEHSKVVKYKNIAQENKIEYKVENASYEASATKAKVGDEITIKITPKSGYVLAPSKTEAKLISAKNKAKTDKPLTISLIECDNKTQTFSFRMPYLADKDDILTVTPSVVKDDTYKTAEATLKATVPESLIDGYTTLTEDYITPGRFDGSKISFKTRGEQVPLLITDGEDRNMGPWRFKFECTDTSVATVAPDGTVTAGSNNTNKNAQITVTLLSTNKTLTIPVQVEESITIDKMDFKFQKWNPRTGKNIFKLPNRVEDVNAPGVGVWKYEEVTEIINGEKVTYKKKLPYHLIVIPKTKIAKGDVTFTTEVLPQSASAIDPEKSYVVNSTWSSRDTSIATVEKKSVNNNLNKITVKKNASGETEIRVKVVNDHLDKADPKHEFEYGYIIRIDDDIPRLTEKSFKINTYKEKGYELQLVEGYKSGAGEKVKYEIAGNKLWVAKADGTDMSSDFLVTYDDVSKTYYIKETEKVSKAIKEGKSKKFTKLYLCGQIADPEDVANDGTFQIPFGTITVIKQKLEAEVTVKGTINTFYDARYDDDDHTYSGAVSLYQSNYDETVEAYYLVTKEHHEEIQKKERDVEVYTTDNPNDPLFDAFRANFTFGYIKDTTGTTSIYRTRTEKLADNEDGEPAVSGYVYVKYKGYKDYLFKEITIPVKKIKPKYILDVASGTASTLQHKFDYNVMLVSKDTKKLPLRDLLKPDGTALKNAKGEIQQEYIDLLREVYVDDGGNVTSEAKYWFDVDTDGNVFDKTRTDFTEKIPRFKDPNNAKKKEETKKYRSIPISVLNANKDKAILWVQLYNWSEPIKYTFTLNTTSKAAKATATPNKVTLYTTAPNTPAEFKVKLNQKFAKLDLKDIKEDGISVTFEQDPVNPYICIAKAEFDGNSASVGKHKFTAEGTVTYGDEADEVVDLAKPVKFSVVVKDKQAQIKLKNSTFKMNSGVAGVELVGTKYSFKNIPVGDNGYSIISENSVSNNTVWINGVSYNGISGNAVVKDYSIECLTKKPKDKDIADKITLKVGKSKKDGDVDLLMVGLEDGKYQNSSYKFLVSGVKLTDKYNNVIELKDFKIKVTIKNSKISVTHKAKGTINPVDPKSDMIFTPKFKNFGNIQIISANFVPTNKYGKTISERNFTLTAVSQNTVDVDKMPNIAVDDKGIVLDNQYMLTVISGNNITKGKEYFGVVKYDFIGADGVVKSVQSKNIKVNLKQKVPTIIPKFASPAKADSKKMSTVMYSGSDRDSVCVVRINPQTQKNAIPESISVYNPANPSKEQKNNKRAFEPNIFKVVPAKGLTGKETRSLRMVPYTYSVYALIDGEMVCITKPASYSVSVNDIDPTSTKMYSCTPQEFDEDVITSLIGEGKVDGDDFSYYADAVTEMQKEECKFFRTFSSNASYENREGHYFVKVTLLNAAAVTKNKATDVTFEVKYKNQIKKTSGTKFVVNITVKK